MKEKLGLHTHLLPTMAKLSVKDHMMKDTMAFVSSAEIFDCRELPLDFVADTGEVAYLEMEATNEPVKLPYETCYLEFDQQIALFVHTYNEEGFGEMVDLQVVKGWSSIPKDVFYDDPRGSFFNNWTPEQYDEWWDNFQMEGEPYEYCGKVPFFNLAGPSHKEVSELEPAARLLLGVLTLLQDKLLINNQLDPDPRPWLSEHRKIRGRHPKSADVHVLSLNVPAIRDATRRESKGGTHESPALHWRRGHWRVLHRGTFLETQTWIRKFLVGDPAKGFVSKNYRLVSNTPILVGQPIDAGALT